MGLAPASNASDSEGASGSGSDSDEGAGGGHSRSRSTSRARAGGAAARAGSAAAAGAMRLPWFGAICAHCLIPSQGSIEGTEDPAAVLTLLEGGELSIQGLSPGDADGGARKAPGSPGRAARGPKGYRARFQGQPVVTAARLRVIPIGRVPLQGLQVGVGRGPLWACDCGVVAARVAAAREGRCVAENVVESVASAFSWGSGRGRGDITGSCVRRVHVLQLASPEFPPPDCLPNRAPA